MFVNLIPYHLTEHGEVAPERHYESPLPVTPPHGPDGLFSSAELDQLIQVLEAVRTTAVAA